MIKTLKQVFENLPDIGRYLLIIGVVIFISYLFPNKVKFKYDYAPGKTWVYSDLDATFDFAIRKNQLEIDEEVSQVKRNFKPLYQLNMDQTEGSTNRMMQALENKFANNKEEQGLENFETDQIGIRKAAKRVFQTVYQKGVVADTLIRNKPKDFKVRLLQRNLVEERTLGDFLTESDAKGRLVDEWYKTEYGNRVILDQLFLNLRPNVIYNDSLNRAKYQEVLDNEISYHRGKVSAGEVIIHRGDVITDEKFLQLQSYESEYLNRISKNKDSRLIRAGHFILTTMLIGMFVLFLMRNAPKVFSSFREMTFLLGWIALFSYIVFVGVRTEMLNLYVLPFCVVPIVVKAFYNARLALFIHVVIVLIASFLSPLGFEFTFVQLMAGIAAVLANFKMRAFSSFFWTVLYIFLAYQLSYLGLTLIREGSIFAIEWQIHGWMALNVFLTLLSYPLIPLTERLFGYTSEITLVELSDLNRPLLRDLSMKAPATLQHSLQVANLCEAACTAIGANSLMVKVAALYHDIGKTVNPLNYIENQVNGINPHDDYTPLQSGQHIIEHVTEGIKMAVKAGLPTVLIDFIRTHHGTTRVEVFYRKHVEAHPEDEEAESKFRYPGPLPWTKEQTIMMVADSLEAASKSLKTPTEDSIRDLTEKIIAGKIAQGQFNDSALSFEELEICKEVFIKTLISIHHVRIAYPDDKKEEAST